MSMRNFLFLSIFWSVTSFNFFLLELYFKYLKGGLYWNTGVSSVAEALGCAVGGLLLAFVKEPRAFWKLKCALAVNYALGIIGSLGVLFSLSEAVEEESWLIPFFILFLNLSIGSSYVVQYAAVIFVAPKQQSSADFVFIFALLNFLAILVSSAGPLLAEVLEQPIPIVLLGVTSTVAMLSSMLLKEETDSNTVKP